MVMAEEYLTLEWEHTGKFALRLVSFLPQNMDYCLTKHMFLSRGVIDAGRAGFHRARGYGNVEITVQSTRVTDETSGRRDGLESEMTESTIADLQVSSGGLYSRRSQPSPLTVPAVTTEASSPQRRRIYLHNLSPVLSPVSHVSDGASIAGLLGLDDEFRIGTCNYSGEDEIREVQLRALTRRIMASPSLVLFPARKADIDVL